MKDTDAAWAAGFFDGEGYVGIARRRNKWLRKKDNTIQEYTAFCLVVKIGQVVEEPLIKLQKLFGGSIAKTARHKTKTNWHQIRNWEIQGPAAETFLIKVRPYLIVKAQQADIALQYRLTVNKGKLDEEKTEAFRILLMSLKKTEKDAANV